MASKKQQAVTGLSSKAEREADLVMGVREGFLQFATIGFAMDIQRRLANNLLEFFTL